MKRKSEKLTGFEKRVKARHKKQEDEFGRDEFLFGAEDDEEVDIEYGNEDASAIAPAAKVDEETTDWDKVTGPPPKPVIGETTAIIADGIVAEELSRLAGELSDEAGTAAETAAETKETGSMIEERSVQISEQTQTDGSEADTTAESASVVEDTQDFDFYDMPEAAEAAAMAAVAAMADAEEANAYAEVALKERSTSKKVRQSESAPPADRRHTKAGRPTKKTGRVAESAPVRKHKTSGKPDVQPSASRKRHGREEDDREEEEKGGFLSGMSVSDRLIVATGICVLIVAVISGTVFVNAQTLKKQIASFEEVGSSMDGIYVVGERGLNASVSARADYVSIVEEPEEEPVEEEEPEEIILEEKTIQIVMKASSVQSDLKIKFSNKATGKLISGIPFSVKVTSDSGKEYDWTDDNKDGIIYHTEVPNGTYSVSMAPLEGTEYENYVAASDVTGIKVTDKIEYKKIDVADEVKTEAEVNVAAEDTAVQDTAVESTLTDTVEWVESTKTLVSGTDGDYVEIDKNDIVLATSLIGRSDYVPLGASSNTYRMQYFGEESDESEETELISTGDDDNSDSGESGNKDNEGESDSGNSDSGNSDSGNSDSGNSDSGNSDSGEKTDNGNSDKNDDDETEVIETDDSAKSVSLSEKALTLEEGDIDTLSAKVKLNDGTTSDSVEWSSSDINVVTVIDGKVTAISSGSAIITATSSDGRVSATCKVTVNKKEENTEGKSDKDKTKATPLKDKDGNQVYVKNDAGDYVAATSGDYEKASVFYVKSKADAVYKYTGWQTLDGFTYYFDKNGDYVTGEQVIQGARYTFDSNGHLSAGSGTMGIDVSKWNGSIDWNAVKNSGVSYVIIRCGYRGSTTGALIEDPKFRSNISGAKAAGLAVGAYFFTQAVNEVEAVEEASMAVSLCSGYGLSMPLFVDVESSGGRADKIGADARTAVVKAFCQTVRNSGYAAGIYANKTWFSEKMHVSQLTAYKIWLAQYAASPTYSASRIDYWQYSSKGKVSGISGNVDMNIKY